MSTPQMLEMLDTVLTAVGGRDLVPGAEMSDLLLDLRLAVARGEPGLVAAGARS